jgi:hypothetical protein
MNKKSLRMLMLVFAPHYALQFFVICITINGKRLQTNILGTNKKWRQWQILGLQYD